MKNATLEKANAHVEKMEGTLLACIQYPDPRDAHLSKVLVHTTENEYVVWTYNSQVDGFHNGHYHRDIRDAVNTLAEIIADLVRP